MSPKQLVLDFEWENIVTQIERLPLRERERNCLIAIARLAEDWQTYDGSLAAIGRAMQSSKWAAKRAADLCIDYGALRIEDLDGRRRRYAINWLTVIDAPELPPGLYDPPQTKTSPAPMVEASAETVTQTATDRPERCTWFFAAWRFVCWVAGALHLVFVRTRESRPERCTWPPDRCTNAAERCTKDGNRCTTPPNGLCSREFGEAEAPKSAETRADRCTCDRCTPASVAPATVAPAQHVHVDVMSNNKHRHQHLPNARARGSGGAKHGGWPKAITRAMLLDREELTALHHWAVTERAWIDGSRETLVWFFACAHHVARQRGNHGAKFTKAVIERWRDFKDRDWTWAKQQLPARGGGCVLPHGASTETHPGGSPHEPAVPDTEGLRQKQQAALAAAALAGKFKSNFK